jgi:predicted nucleic acid-binding Zn ribbon protein
MKRRAPRPLSQIVPGFTAALAPASMLARVQTVWERAAGAAIASCAKPTGERDGVLTVTCEAAVWAQELDLMAGELIAKINAQLPGEPIRELRCRTG